MAKHDKKGNKRGKGKIAERKKRKEQQAFTSVCPWAFERVPEASPTLRRHYATITGQFVFEGIPSGKSHGYRDVIDFKQLRYQIVFCPLQNAKHFLKLAFRDELVWTASLTIEIKLRSLITLQQCGHEEA